ncbi:MULTISPECIES: hypothetical protein [unclassified Pseudomonas]|uniref:hypothetical protein n=1 Tax=unclassified Pseudomonas TaxID=196821 RepID=UPI0025E9DB88|nr:MULTISPECIES: hypothetical protein [unclassified Pseudomonas]
MKAQSRCRRSDALCSIGTDIGAHIQNTVHGREADARFASDIFHRGTQFLTGQF